MSDDLISKICDPQNEDRDLFVDELNDEIEAESYNEEETLSIIQKLLGLLSTESNQVVHESILNLLSGVYPSGIGRRDIDEYVLSCIRELKTGSLIHALTILSESNLEERKEIFSTFSRSDNEAIRRVARDYLSEM